MSVKRTKLSRAGSYKCTSAQRWKLLECDKPEKSMHIMYYIYCHRQFRTNNFFIYFFRKDSFTIVEPDGNSFSDVYGVTNRNLDVEYPTNEKSKFFKRLDCCVWTALTLLLIGVASFLAISYWPKTVRHYPYFMCIACRLQRCRIKSRNFGWLGGSHDTKQEHYGLNANRVKIFQILNGFSWQYSLPQDPL